MTIPIESELERLPAVVFQFCGRKLELLNGDCGILPQLTAAKLSKILRGDWRKLVPEEFHPVVQKLASISDSEGHITVEFPVYWMGNAIWLRIFAAADADRKGKPRIIGLAQDMTLQRHAPTDGDQSMDENEDPWRKLRHEINSSLTSIIMNCELVMSSEESPQARQKIEGILSEALRIDQMLHRFRG